MKTFKEWKRFDQAREMEARWQRFIKQYPSNMGFHQVGQERMKTYAAWKKACMKERG